ncbi:MAG: TIGR01777 family protein [Flavobacteriales bacterium]|nr:TIGR01777 family protein [Flavobacteriales bacterium]
MSKHTIAISGGTGLVGKALTKKLLKAGHQVVILSRSQKSSDNDHLTYSQWNPANGELDVDLISRCYMIVNLAGSPISDKWTAQNKAKILSSRIDSTSTLVDFMKSESSNIKRFVTASAIGIYPSSDQLQSETAPAGDHFMAEVVKRWEEEASVGLENTPGAIIRIGVVLSIDGGALEKMTPVFKLGIGSPLGDGKQYQSWIHIDDLVSIFLHALDGEIEGVVNAVAPHPVTTSEFSEALAKVLKKPYWAAKVPAFVRRTVLGPMSDVVLLSQNVSAKKIQDSGFKFQHETIQEAFSNLFGA